MNTRRWILLCLLVPALGLSVFALAVSRVSHVERMKWERVSARADSVRATFSDPQPVVTTDDEGHLVVGPVRNPQQRSIHTLHVLAYRRSIGRLVQVDVPVWFLRLKAPAIRFAMRETGVDLQELGLTVADIRRHGPRILVDERRPGEDRVLVWTEGNP